MPSGPIPGHKHSTDNGRDVRGRSLGDQGSVGSGSGGDTAAYGMSGTLAPKPSGKPALGPTRDLSSGRRTMPSPC